MNEHDHHGLDCRAVLEELYEYIDGELGAADRELVREHLERCRPCLTHFEYEELFHQYVKRHAPRPRVSDDFKARLSQRLRQEAKVVAFSGASGGQATRHTFPRFALAASIMLLITVGAWWMTKNAGPKSCDWTTLALIHQHDESVGPPIVSTATGSTIEAMRLIAEKIEGCGTFIPRSVPSELVTREVRIMPWKRHPIGQVEWRCPTSGKGVSLFVSNASCLPLTDEPKYEIGGRCYRMATIGGYRAICWNDPSGYVCVMMAEQGFDTMLAWAEQMREPSSF
ncbi:MAG: hypothetical protein Kow0074_24350 [Candidatus Zixiibacteriota bacterium]